MRMVPVSFYCESYLLVDEMRVDCAKILVLVARRPYAGRLSCLSEGFNSLSKP